MYSINLSLIVQQKEEQKALLKEPCVMDKTSPVQRHAVEYHESIQFHRRLLPKILSAIQKNDPHFETSKSHLDVTR